ncbi:hypothetical protein BDN71DRAFT_1509859 [Pleurotus eryngii]|uniref:Protein kinase domain-containing protein n=1 Tax=Pleurotus eryngii TaxID=5323 RepID=A0A9P6DCN5_PLEER|nr:hypothetical protein BDN71DRAFT_1509859 [Pleurotus eryngii]
MDLMVAERKLLHRDISHANIVVEAKDAQTIQKFKGTKPPVFINEILRGKPALSMARLLDLDNCANLKTSKVKLEEGKDNDEPLRYRTGTLKFIA